MAKATPMMLPVPGPEGVREVRLTSPDRVVYPAHDGAPEVTKAGLAAYLIDVGEQFVRLNGDRPITLQRFPTGIEGEEFFAKNPPKGAPEYAATVGCTYPSGRRHPQLVVNELAVAVWAVQMSTVTFHPWPVRTADVDNPDELRIDLDPQPGRVFADVVEAAHGLREVVTEAGLAPYVKTSGNRGVHVCARIVPDHEFLDVRHGVIGLARELERRMPQLVTTDWWKEERGERIFVDYNQACRDRTLAGAYSPRPLPGATVSTPVSWEELGQVDPGQFTVHSVPERVAGFAKDGDPWAGLEEGEGSLGPALELWQADLDRGLGELNFPPDYPKMPGEPRRVQPSKRRDDLPDPQDREGYVRPTRWIERHPKEADG